MLNAIREKTSGWIAGAIIAILILPFALYGIGEYTGGVSVDNNLAVVGEAKVTPSEFDRELAQERSRMEQMFGAQFDPQMINNPEAKRALLDRMVDRLLREEQANNAGVAVSADQLRKSIQEMEVFQVDGKFNLPQYQAILQANGMTIQSFETLMRRDLKVNALGSSLGASSFATTAAATQYVLIREEKRDFRFIRLELADAGDMTEPTEAEIEAAYNASKADYMTPEQVDLEYVELLESSLQVPDVTEDLLKERYSANESKYVVPEQRRAAHILLEVPAGADADAQKAVQASAQSLVEQLRGGADFAELAKANSKDIGSADQGGELGFIEKGATEPAFEAALFALAEGAISDPVYTDQGFHVIKLLELKAEERKTFEDARAELEAEYRGNEANRLFNDKAGQLVDSINKDPLSLSTAIRELGLEAKRTGMISAIGGPGIASNPTVLKDAFSDPVKNRGQNSELITLAPGHVAVIRVAEIKAPEQQPLAEVAEAVKAKLLQSSKTTALKAKADALLERLKAGETLDAIATELDKTPEVGAGTTRVSGFPTQILAVTFSGKLGADNAPMPFLTDLGTPEQLALGELTAINPVTPADVDPKQIEAAAEQLAQERSVAEGQAVLKSLRESSKVNIKEDAFQ